MTRRGSRLNVKTETPAPKGPALRQNSHRNYRRDAERALRVRDKKQQTKPEGFG